jgi:hypothetical protein
MNADNMSNSDETYRLRHRSADRNSAVYCLHIIRCI